MEKTKAIIKCKHGFEQISINYNSACVLNMHLIVCDRKDINRIQQHRQCIIYDGITNLNQLTGRTIIVTIQQLKQLGVGNRYTQVFNHNGLYDRRLDCIKMMLRFSKTANYDNLMHYIQNVNAKLQNIDARQLHRQFQKYLQFKFITLCEFAVENNMQYAYDLLYILIIFQYLQDVKFYKVLMILRQIQDYVQHIDYNHLQCMIDQDPDILISKRVIVPGCIFSQLTWASQKPQLNYNIYGVLQQ